MSKRLVQLLLLGCLPVMPAVAQRGGHGGGGFHGGKGFGGGAGGGFRGGSFHGGGGFRGGYYRGGWYRGGYYPAYGFGFGGYYGAGWGYPYYGYYPYWGYSYPYAVSGPYVYSYPDSYAYTSSAPVYDAPAYGAPMQTSCPVMNGMPLYLIKLTYQDKIWAARDYWYTPGTLNFVSTQSELHKTPTNTIDRGATFQLNRGCGINFQFPH